jgi:hypothetical protein
VGFSGEGSTGSQTSAETTELARPIMTVYLYIYGVLYWTLRGRKSGRFFVSRKCGDDSRGHSHQTRVRIEPMILRLGNPGTTLSPFSPGERGDGASLADRLL